jgi:hypothetical protein
VRAVEVAKRLKEERPSFLKKSLAGREAKRLSVLRALAASSPAPAGGEVFLVTFFSKKVTAYFL